MDLFSARLVPVRGEGGWLARLPGAVVFVPNDGEDAREMVSACLACGGAMELLGGVGSRLADPRAAPWPSFVVIAARGAELVAVVHGPVEVVVVRAADEERLYGGDDVGSWLNKVLAHVQALYVGHGDLQVGHSERTDGPVDLREGVVRAGGFLLVPPPGDARTGDARTGDARTGDARNGDARNGDGRAGVRGHMAAGTGAPVSGGPERPTVIDLPAPAEDATLAEPGASVLEAMGTGDGAHGAARHAHPPALVRGVFCPRKHLNDPRATTCRACGLPIAAGAPQVEGPRPSLGRLTWDNGEVDHVPGAALVGRDVALDATIVAGELVPLVPAGHNDSMSRVHAELRPLGWDVVVIDRGSTNGTFVWDEASRGWQRLLPGEAHVLQPGAVLAFGERTATFEPTDMPAG